MNKKEKIRKITIVTIIDNCNFGTFLQAFALFKYLKSLNPSACIQIANYHRKVTSPCFVLKELFTSHALGFTSKIWGLYSQLLLYPSIRKRFHKDLKKQGVSFTKRIKNVTELSKINSDIYIAGSDQIWNSFYNHGIDDVYYLAFDKNNSKKYAYAASFGGIESNESETIIHLLKDFDKITLREKMESVPQAELLNFLNKCSAQVLDPTLLFDKNFYIKQSFPIRHKNVIKKHEKYLLIYSVERNKVTKLLEVAKVLSNKLNLKIYYIESVFNAKNLGLKVDKKITNASMGDFINLYNNASFVLASSFHGTVFSIIFRKQFFTLRPDNFDIRISALLSQFALSERIIDANTSIEEVLKEKSIIDYSIIEKQLNSAINNSKVIAGNMVNGEY